MTIFNSIPNIIIVQTFFAINNLKYHYKVFSPSLHSFKIFVFKLPRGYGKTFQVITAIDIENICLYLSAVLSYNSLTTFRIGWLYGSFARSFVG